MVRWTWLLPLCILFYLLAAADPIPAQTSVARPAINAATHPDASRTIVPTMPAGASTAARVGTQALSDVATLSDLTLSSATLYPQFSSSTTAYTASTGYADTQTTVTATTTGGNASVAFLDGNGNTLPDADVAVGSQVDLEVGLNVIRVEVTAQDGVSVMTYSITVHRAALDTSLTPPASDPVVAGSSSAVYTVTFEGRWTTDVTPGGLPGGAHFTRLIGAVHNAGVTFLESGGTASPGVESMAELGETATLKAEINDEINSSQPDALSVIEGSASSVGPSATTSLGNVRLTSGYPRVTLTTMIAPSHDWFVGVSGLVLLDASGGWSVSREVDLFPWDAGTEEGNHFSLNPSVDTVPRGVIRSIRGEDPFSAEPIARLTLTRHAVSPAFPASESGARVVAENTAAGVDFGSPFVAADPDSGDSVSYSLAGPDAASFGQLRTVTALDHEERDTHYVTVVATDTFGLTGGIDVTITVSNEEEAGAISLSSQQPRVGAPLTATLEDPDGHLAPVIWTWERSSDRVSWRILSGATSASYTPLDGDVGGYLRVTASYTDGQGPGKRAQTVSANPVQTGMGSPTPPADPCVTILTGDGSVTGEWAQGCDSQAAGRGYARYYTFTLSRQAQVTVILESQDADTYLYLRAEDARSGDFLHQKTTTPRPATPTNPRSRKPWPPAPTPSRPPPTAPVRTAASPSPSSAWARQHPRRGLSPRTRAGRP